MKQLLKHKAEAPKQKFETINIQTKNILAYERQL